MVSTIAVMCFSVVLHFGVLATASVAQETFLVVFFGLSRLDRLVVVENRIVNSLQQKVLNQI